MAKITEMAADTPEASGPNLHRRLRRMHDTQSALLAEIVRLSGPVLPHDLAAARYVPVETDLSMMTEGTVFTFSGLHADHRLPGGEFVATLDGAPVAKVIVKDLAAVWYQQGLTGLGESRATAFAALADRFADLPRPWTCIGNSAGGYAAIYAGHVMQADRIVAFSPQTNVDRDTFVRFARDYPRLRAYDVRAADNDLLAALPAYAPVPTDIWFADQHPVDSAHARRLGVLPQVRLHPLPIKTHASAAHLREQGKLRDAILKE